MIPDLPHTELEMDVAELVTRLHADLPHHVLVLLTLPQ